MEHRLQQKLRRLNRLVGSDPGFYVLALHSFVEHYIKDILAASEFEHFSDVVWEYRNRLIDEAAGAHVDGLYCLHEFGKQHKFTNRVRHAFGAMDAEEARATTHLFLVFCTLVRLNALPEVKELERSFDVWNERKSLGEQARILKALQSELAELHAGNKQLLSRLDEFEAQEAELAKLENKIESFSLEIDKERKRAKEKDKRVDELRHERARLRDERRDLLKQMEQYEELERYIHNLGRMSVYTRTRLDYERTLMRLTPEQEEAAAAISGDADFLIRGGAGTGKSLVLIEALRRSRQVGELDFGVESNDAILLTFNRTLAKFEDYVMEILGIGAAKRLVQTVDFFILERLRRVEAEAAFDFEAVERVVAEANNLEFLTDLELATEIEAFLFANVITREEYVESVIPRLGLRRRLSRGQREQVWAIRDECARRMEEAKAYSRNYARIKLLNAIESGAGDGLHDVRTIYLDEAQDLTAGDILTLKRLITGHLVMAADIKQSIYGVASPFARAGVRVAGRTKVLRTNFRNSRQVHEAAVRFAGSKTEGSFAFREGPPPELFAAENPKELLSLLQTKLRLFVDSFGYEPDNICILVPHKAELERVGTALSNAGWDTAVITDKEFQFAVTGSVRISTLHSSKGLDFPVVLMFVPYLNRREKFDDDAAERLLRNLLFVGMTRAMEHLNAFVVPGDDPILRDFCAALEG